MDKLQECIASVHRALNTGGVFCFNAVDKYTIDNRLFAQHSVQHADDLFTFSSGWHYSGEGAQQSLKVSIAKTNAHDSQIWHDEHPMVAFSFTHLQDVLKPYFEVHIFEHDYEKIMPWEQSSGNAIFVCVKIESVMPTI